MQTGYTKLARVFTALVTIAAIMVACKQKIPASSEVQSLTESELQFCQFKGKRISFVVAPDANFQKDVQGAREVFNEMTHTFLVSRSYIADKFQGDPEQLKKCKVALDQLGKYEDGPVLAGRITKAEFTEELQRLRRKIEAYRRGEPDGEVQIVMIFTSHGSQNTAGSGGNLVLGDVEVPFNEVARLIHDHVLSHDDPRNPSSTLRLADEVMILMDNCYSGNFSQELGTWLKNQAYSGGTRLLAMTASGNQTAVGQIGQSGYGTLVAGFLEVMRSWSADFNSDGVMSFAEVIQFFQGYQSGNFSQQSARTFTDLAARLMCVDASTRSQAYRQIDGNPSFFQSFFNEPIKTVKSEEAGPMETLKIQTPTFYTNLNGDDLTKLAFAVTKAGGHKLPDGEVKTKADGELAKLSQDQIRKVGAMVKRAYDLIKADVATWLSNDPGKFKPVTAADISVATNDEQQVIKAIEAKCQDIKDRAMGGGMPGDNFGNETQDPNFSNGPESMPGGQINSVNSSGGPQNGEIDPLELEGDDNDTSGYLPLGFE